MDQAEQQKRKDLITTGFMDWIVQARKIADDHFPNERAGSYNQIVVEMAKALMQMHQISKIETELRRISLAMENQKES